MRSGLRLRQLGCALAPALALMCALPVAAAGAHRDAHPGGFWHHRFWRHEAAVAGTVTSVGTGSFGANAHVVTPGPGNSMTTPATTAVTITIGSSTRVITPGQTGIAQNDQFYAIYAGVPASTPLATLAGDTPSVVYAWAAPAPEVEVRGVVTTAPVSGSDSFSATACVAEPRRGHCLPGSTPIGDGTPNATITTDGATRITIDGQTSSVSELAVGDRFTAVYDGAPDEPLATIASTFPLSVDAWAPLHGDWLYAFVGTVSGIDTTAGTVSVNVTRSVPNGFFSGADTFDVGSQTIVLGMSGGTPFGSLGNLATGDVVAGGLIAPSGESPATVESTPLHVLVDFPQSSSSTMSATARRASIRRAERRALKLLRRERAKYRHHEHR